MSVCKTNERMNKIDFELGFKGSKILLEKSYICKFHFQKNDLGEFFQFQG
jgi:hypothetical protein